MTCTVPWILAALLGDTTDGALALHETTVVCDSVGVFALVEAGPARSHAETSAWWAPSVVGVRAQAALGPGVAWRVGPQLATRHAGLAVYAGVTDEGGPAHVVEVWYGVSVGRVHISGWLDADLPPRDVWALTEHRVLVQIGGPLWLSAAFRVGSDRHVSGTFGLALGGDR